MPAASGTVRDGLGQVGERQEHVVGFDVRQPERPDARRVDHPALAVEGQRDRLSRRVLALAHTRHFTRRPIRFRHKAVHECGLADARMAQQHRDLVGQQRRDRVQRVVAARGDHGEIQVGELRGERFGWGEVRFRQAKNRFQASGVRGDQRALDKPGARWRIGQRHHDEQLVGVGDHNAFGGVGVVGGAAQNRPAFAAAHDAGQGVGSAGQIADHVHVVTHHDRRAAQFAGAHRGDSLCGVAVQRATPPPTVDGDHHRRTGVGMVGAGLGPRTRAPTRSDPDVGLVVVPSAPCAQREAPASMSAHIRGKSGSVLAVVAMFSTSTPGVRSPTMAPAVAIR